MTIPPRLGARLREVLATPGLASAKETRALIAAVQKLTDEPVPSRHELFRITALPGGVVDVAVCWDQIDVRELASSLRQIADGLDTLPSDTRADGVVPL